MAVESAAKEHLANAARPVAPHATASPRPAASLPAPDAPVKTTKDGTCDLPGELARIIKLVLGVGARVQGAADETTILSTLADAFMESQQCDTTVLLLDTTKSRLVVTATSLSPGIPTRREQGSPDGAGGAEGIDLRTSVLGRQVVLEAKTVRCTLDEVTGDPLGQAATTPLERAAIQEAVPCVLTPLWRQGQVVGALAMSSSVLARYLPLLAQDLAQSISSALETPGQSQEHGKKREKPGPSTAQPDAPRKGGITGSILGYGPAGRQLPGRAMQSRRQEQHPDLSPSGPWWDPTPSPTVKPLASVGRPAAEEDRHAPADGQGDHPADGGCPGSAVGASGFAKPGISANTPQQTLTDPRALTNDFLDTSLVGILILDANIRVVWANQAWEHYFDIDRQDLIGRGQRQLVEEQIKHILADPEGFTRRVYATYADNTYVEDFECHVLGDGKRQERWLAHRSQPIVAGPYAGGRIEHYTDIGERKQAQEMATQHREASMLKTSLFSLISHELRSPLASIKGFSSMLLEMGHKIGREEEKEYLTLIDGAADRLTELVARLTDMSLLEAGLLRIRREPTCVRQLLEESLAEVKVRSPGRTFRLTLANNPATANIDGRRIRQVLGNLLDNAVKYSPKSTTVMVSAETSEDELRLVVSDKGRGLPPAELDRVFLPGYRVQHRLDDPGGMGLGLPFCRGVVEAHEGRIWMESAVGEGTRVNIALPLRPADPVPGQAEPLARQLSSWRLNEDQPGQLLQLEPCGEPFAPAMVGPGLDPSAKCQIERKPEEE